MISVYTRKIVAATVVVGGLFLGACSGPADDKPLPRKSQVSTSPTGPTSPEPPSGDGSAAGVGAPLGAKYDWSRFDIVSPYLKTLSGSSTFYELVWCDIEPKEGQQDWKTMDAVARKAQTVGAKLMIKIRVGACWATAASDPQHLRGKKNKTESFMPSDMNKYNSFVTSVVKRYSPKGVHVYAVENEINSESFWGGTTTEFETLIKAAANSIRAADPTAEVADPGISSTAYGAGIAKRLLEQGKPTDAVKAWNTYYSRRIGTRGDQIQAVTSPASLSAALNADQTKRNLEYLALAEKLQKAKVVDIRQVHFYESWEAAPAYVEYLKATTPTGMPIEAWEVGQFLKEGNLDDEQRAQEMVKTVSILLGGGMRRVLWLPLVMNPEGRNSDEPRYGLLDPDGSPRPTGVAFVAMAQAASGATATAVVSKGMTGVALEKNGSTQAFVWSTQGDVTVKLGGGDVAKGIGTKTAPSAAGSVTIGTAPLQISSKRPASSLLGSS